MPIPDFQTLMRPVLAALSDGSPHRSRDLIPALSDQFGLSEHDRKQLLPSGAQEVMDNRVFWAMTHLAKAGLLSRPQRGFAQITPAGSKALLDNPARIDIKVLMNYPGFREFRFQTATQSPAAASHAQPADAGTPEEILEGTWKSLKDTLGAELLAKVKASSPKFFEKLVLDLLLAMGYGGSLADAATMLGTSGDQGVDGVIKEDKLGLDVVYVQAKRWDNQVSRPVVQAFAGSLEGQRARKGVMITTSTFSTDALAYVGKIEKRIVLIDGARLVDLMIEHNIGTAIARIYEVKRIDTDYFEEDSSIG